MTAGGGGSSRPRIPDFTLRRLSPQGDPTQGCDGGFETFISGGGCGEFPPTFESLTTLTNIQGAFSPDKNKTWRGLQERKTFFLCLNFYGKSDPRLPPLP